MSSPIIIKERKRHCLLFSGLDVAAGTHQTSVSGQLSFKYRVLKVKIYFLDNCVPDLRYYVLIGTTNGTSTTSLPEGTSIFAPYSTQNAIRGSQGTLIFEPLYDVDLDNSFLKVHVHNNDAVFACDYAAEIEIERMG